MEHQVITQGSTIMAPLRITKGSTMDSIISSSHTQFNSDLSRSSVVSSAAIHTSVGSLKRPYLPAEQFQDANTQKRAWFKAAIRKHGLRCSEIPILEALVYFTDPVHGIGDPAIGTLKERLQEQCKGDPHYDTISDALERLAQKGAITKLCRPNKTIVFGLVGYKYKSKLESGSGETPHDLNSYSVRIDQCNKKRNKTNINSPTAKPEPPPQTPNFERAKQQLISTLRQQAGVWKPVATTWVERYGIKGLTCVLEHAKSFNPDNLGRYMRHIIKTSPPRFDNGIYPTPKPPTRYVWLWKDEQGRNYAAYNENEAPPHATKHER